MANQKVRLRGVKGKPLADKAGSAIPLSREQLQTAGRTILAEIRKEIRKDQAKVAVRQEGAPVPIPLGKSFVESFKYRLVGKSTIEIFSDWPSAEAHVTSAEDDSGKVVDSAPIPMKWLVRNKVRVAKMILTDGQVIFRMTPNPYAGDELWIHPGFRRYTFIERGVRKGREVFIEKLIPDLIRSLLETTDVVGDG